MENFISDDRIHEGHRGRMRAKLKSYGQRIFDTYELLEMLLYNVVPYKDTNPIAKRLLHAFGDLDGVFSADKDELMSVNGIGERATEYINLVSGLSDIIGAEILPKRSARFDDYRSVGEYLVGYFSGLETKQTIAVFLDSSMRPIKIKKMCDEDFESGGVKAKPFVDEAIRTRAAVVITAHNHPFGPFYPTPGDRESNTLITEALAMAGVVHAEHYLVSGNSYAGMGSIKNFVNRLSQNAAIDGFIEGRDKFGGEVWTVRSSVDVDTKVEYDPTAPDYSDSYDYLASLLAYCTANNAGKIAELIMTKYLTIENAFSASYGELSALCGEGCAAYVKLLAYITSRRQTDKFRFGICHSKAEICDYLKALFIGESVEKTYLICFDKNGRTSGVHMLSEGTVNSSEILPRKAMEIAIDSSAIAVSLAHNHPFGTTKPSSDDVNITKHFISLFATCDIRLVDHFIIAGQLCDGINFDF